MPAGPHLLACGAELKSTFCLARDGRAWLSHHVGDLKNVETLASYGEGVELLERLFAVVPEVVAHDLHPDYLSTRFALGRDGVETIAIQHHHAHLAACLAEHGETGPAVGAIFDGAGLGPDGTVWGGELLLGDLAGLRARGTPAAGAPPRRRPGGPAALADGVRVAGRGARRAATAPRGAGGRVDGRAWGAVSRDGAHRRGLAGHHQRRAPVRRGRPRCAACGRRSPTRARPR